MKKKIVLALTVCALAAAVTACGSKNNSTPASTAPVSSESTNAADETKKETEKATEETTVDPKEAAGPGAVEPSDATGEEAVIQENKNFEDLEKSDYAGFAKEITTAVAAKDIQALADLMAYPTYIACVSENEGIVDSKEAFLALDPEVLFDETLLDAIAKADLENLEPLMTGIVLGEDTPNIIFNSVDGKLGIVAINY